MDKEDLKAKIEEGNLFHEDYIEGTKYMVPQKHNDWLKFVNITYKRFGSKGVKPIIDVLKDLSNNVDFDLLKTKIDERFDDGAGYSFVVNALVRFGKKGPEFYEYICPEMNDESRQYVNEQKLKNSKYDYELKYGEPEENSLCKDY